MSPEPGGPSGTRPNGPAALLVAHPGHELGLFGWLEQRRPTVFVLTDGSGRGRARLASTARLLEHCGAAPGSIFGRFTDAEIYGLMVRREPAPLCGLASEMAEELERLGAATVVTDAVEGYNPTHDVCHHVARAAVRLAEARGARRMELFDYAVVGRPDRGEVRPEDLRLRLDPATARRKIAQARGYADMQSEVETALQRFGHEAFTVEHLRRSDPRGEQGPPAEPPAYETHGAERVAAGHYATVIRRRDHVQPLVCALEALAP